MQLQVATAKNLLTSSATITIFVKGALPSGIIKGENDGACRNVSTFIAESEV
jgi:hypothetical protein